MFVRWLPLVLAAVLATGCGQLFGLDSPSLVPDAPPDGDTRDTDGDGVVDSVDNCPEVANPDQLDVDANKIGDRCEGCVTLRLRAQDDDDGDQLADITDPCIGKSGGAADTDGDGIADGCDPRIGVDTRFCVWTFRNPDVTEDAAFWTTAWDLPTARWEVKDSQLTKEATSAVEIAGPLNSYFEAEGGIAFDTRLTASNFAGTMMLGGDLELLTTGTPVVLTCRLAQSGGSPALELLNNGVVEDAYTIPVALPNMVGAYVRFVVVSQSSGLTVRCTTEANLLPSTTLSATLPAMPVRVRPRLFSSAAQVAWDHVTLYKLGSN